MTTGTENEFSAGWRIVLGAFVGLFFSIGTLVIYSFGLFVPEFVKEFGWSRGQISLALTVFNYSIVIASPLYGIAIDRFGARAAILMSTLLFAPCYLALAFIGDSLIQFYGVFALMAILGGGTLPVSYSRLIIGWFDRSRGLALGLSLVGVGVGAAVLPPFTQYVIGTFGWRSAAMVLSGGILLISLPVAALLLRDPDRQVPQVPASRSTGLGAEMMRSRPFWVLLIFSVASGIFLIGMVTNFVPVLIDRGVEASSAAKFASVMGVSVIVGRVGIGFLVDRIFAPRVIFCLYLAPITALIVLLNASAEFSFFFAGMAFGLSLGAEVDVIAYMVSRYFPREKFGLLYGVMFGAFTVGAANGPLLLGVMFDRDGSYDSALAILAVVAGFTALLTFLMPRFERPDVAEPVAMDQVVAEG